MLFLKKLVILLLLLGMTACATQGRMSAAKNTMSPREVVMAAADAAVHKKAFRAEVDMVVKAVGESRGMVFLNSEKDYRDQRCLSVVIAPKAQTKFREKHGEPPHSFFQGKRILVHGPAQRVKINISDDANKATGDYYYQTHLLVKHVDQISVRSAGKE